jgi:hypothetical protein
MRWRARLDAFTDPGRGRWVSLVASGAVVATLLAAAFAIITFSRPSANRYVPPEKLPGPRVESDALGRRRRGRGPGRAVRQLRGGRGRRETATASTTSSRAGAHYSGQRYLQGRVALYLGNRDGKLGAPAWVAYGLETGDYFGAYVGAAGDVNHDGYADVLITDQTPRASDHEEVRSVFLLPRLAPRGLGAEPAARIMGWQPHANFGGAVTGIGDVNRRRLRRRRDRRHQLHPSNPVRGRRVRLSRRTERPRGTTRLGCLRRARATRGFGNLMTRAGDVNHGRLRRPARGRARMEGRAHGERGRALLFLGGPHGLASTPSWTAEGNQAGGVMGYSVGGRPAM